MTGQRVFSVRYASPLGALALESDGEALTALRFDVQPDAQPSPLCPVLREALRWLDDYFGGRLPDFTPPLRPAGTPFRAAVWERLLAIPYGETVSYGALARELAAQRGMAAMSAQAVGGAVGHNPIALMIPCHRVIGADGSLTGYAAGLERKRRLLAHERAVRNHIWTPGLFSRTPWEEKADTP